MEKKELIQEVVTAKSLAFQLKIDPKLLRQNLRFLSSEKIIQPKKGTWTWSPDDKDVQTIINHIAKLRETQPE